MAAVFEAVRRIVGKAAHKFGLSDLTEDLTQEVLIKVVKRSGKYGTSYLQRFDPTKNCLDGYLKTLIRNHLCRAHTRRKRQEEGLASLMTGLFSAVHPAEDVGFCREYWMLDAIYPYTTGVVYREGTPLGGIARVVKKPYKPRKREVVLWRSTATVVMLLRAGFSQAEIAQGLKVYRGWVSKKVRILREHYTSAAV